MRRYKYGRFPQMAATYRRSLVPDNSSPLAQASTGLYKVARRRRDSRANMRLLQAMRVDILLPCVVLAISCVQLTSQERQLPLLRRKAPTLFRLFTVELHSRENKEARSFRWLPPPKNSVAPSSKSTDTTMLDSSSLATTQRKRSSNQQDTGITVSPDLQDTKTTELLYRSSSSSGSVGDKHYITTQALPKVSNQSNVGAPAADITTKILKIPSPPQQRPAFSLSSRPGDAVRIANETSSIHTAPTTPSPQSEQPKADAHPNRSWVSISSRTSNTSTAPGQQLEHYKTDMYANSSRSRRDLMPLVLLPEDHSARQNWFSGAETCRQKPLFVRLQPRGCLARRLRTSACEGTCHSRSVPKWEMQTLHRVTYCTCCKPHRLSYQRVHFRCPGRTRKRLVFYLGVASDCACRPCSDGNPRPRQPYDY